jgi:hypothetical protein
MKQEITLRIVLEKPLPGIDYGVQKGGGNSYQTIEKQRSGEGNLVFEFNVTAKTEGDIPDFSGPVVQGPKGERFVYLDIGTYAGQINTIWERRLKVPLRGISTETISELIDKPDAFLETKVPGIGKDGTPSCGTVKPFEGWFVH